MNGRDWTGPRGIESLDGIKRTIPVHSFSSHLHSMGLPCLGVTGQSQGMEREA